MSQQHMHELITGLFFYSQTPFIFYSVLPCLSCLHFRIIYLLQSPHFPSQSGFFSLQLSNFSLSPPPVPLISISLFPTFTLYPHLSYNLLILLLTQASSPFKFQSFSLTFSLYFHLYLPF